MAHKTPNAAEAKLTDLDVREVSVVDRPANKRRFLIVKRDEGLAVIRTEETMSRTAIPRAEAEEFGHILLSDDGAVGILKDEDLAELVGADDGDAEAEEDEDVDAEDEVIEKGAVSDTVSIAKAALAKLMAVVNKLKKEKEAGGKPDSSVLSVVRQVAAALTALVEKLGDSDGKGKDKDKEEDTTEKAAKDALAVCTAAIGSLTNAINQLKDAEADGDVPPPVINVLRAVANALSGLAGGDGGNTEEEGKGKGKGKKPPVEETEKQSRLEVFMKRGDESADPEVMIKVGTKMKRTRLSLFKKAVEMLADILKELSPSDQDRAKGSKANQDFQRAMLEKLDGIGASVGKVVKRVDELEAGGRPAGADDDPKVVEKKQKGLWSGILD
jgi:hypothetical protein